MAKISQNPHELSPLSYGAIGDAYGFCFEFALPEYVDSNNNLRYPVPVGVYSDDTQMQLALGEIIASGAEWTPEAIADRFVEAFRRDPRDGYARGFKAFLESVSSGAEFIENIKPVSDRNGAAMRAPVVGMYPSLDEVVMKSEMQAKLTHDTKGGVDSAIAAALMAHFFAWNLGAKEELPQFLNRLVPGYSWEEPWSGLVPVHGISTVKAALTAVVRNDTLADLLKDCVAFTGDVDSVAIIALASASCHHGYARNIPSPLWTNFEHTTYGMSYIQLIDVRVREAIKYRAK